MSSSSSISLSSSSAYSDALDTITALIAEEDDESDSAPSLLDCGVCGMPGKIGASENYHDVPGGMKFAHGTSREPIYHFVPHDPCRKGWIDSVVAYKACSICKGDAPVTSVNGRRISEIKKDEEKKENTSSTKES